MVNVVESELTSSSAGSVAPRHPARAIIATNTTAVNFDELMCTPR